MADVNTCSLYINYRQTFTQMANQEFFLQVSKVENDKDSTASNSSLIKYPCNCFGKPNTEIKVNRKTTFGMTTLVLTDLSSKFTPLKNDRSDSQTPDGNSYCDSPRNYNYCQNNTCQRSGKKYEFHSANSLTAVNTASPSHHQSDSSNPVQKKQKIDHSGSDFKSNVSLSNRYVIFQNLNKLFI